MEKGSFEIGQGRVWPILERELEALPPGSTVTWVTYVVQLTTWLLEFFRVHQLRLKIRRHKSEIERLENRLGELEIEANLAGVPEEWRS